MVPRLTLMAAASALGALAAGPPNQLTVLRVVPNQVAESTDEVRITFDRPVAVELDGTVDPATFFSIRPAVQGQLQWLDPVTVRFKPAQPLAPSTEYSVTLANTFDAMDGTRLAAPFQFTFRVRGPRTLHAVARGGHSWNFGIIQIAPTTRFDVVLSDPASTDGVEMAGAFVLHETCRVEGYHPNDFVPGRRIGLRVVSQREIVNDDPPQLRYLGNYSNPEARARHRLVTVEPETALPADCPGQLDMAAELGEGGEDARRTWNIATHGPFQFAVARCSQTRFCPVGPLELRFSTPVSGADLRRHVRITPEVPLGMRDTLMERFAWNVATDLTPNTQYQVTVDAALHDVYGQSLTGTGTRSTATTGFRPAANYLFGRALVERGGFQTLSVTHINLDTLRLLEARIPRSLEGRFISTSWWNLGDLWPLVDSLATMSSIPANQGPDDRWVTTGLPISAPDAQRNEATLRAVRVHGVPEGGGNVLVAQVTNLAIHAKVGVRKAHVWVTGADDGLPRRNVLVTVHDNDGGPLGSAITNTDGLATIQDVRPRSGEHTEDWAWGAEGYVSARLREDRALAGVSQYDPDLSPWRFNVRGAAETDRYPEAGGVFTERDIYRPTEPVYAKAIVREGQLGDLHAPAAGDSIRWIFRDRDGGAVHDTIVRLSQFGTSDHRFTIPDGAPLGSYRVEVLRHRDDGWQELTAANYRVAEYRPPEFLVTVTGDTAIHFAEDSASFGVEARYLFGAAMGRAAVTWSARQLPGGWLTIPTAEEYLTGVSGYWWEHDDTPPQRVTSTGGDTLDLTGHRIIHVPLQTPPNGRPARTVLQTTVTDVNRQTVTSSAAVTVHPAAFYVGVHPIGEEYFWQAGEPVTMDVITIRPRGERVSGVEVTGTIVRREWHRVRRERNGYSQLVGEWVMDTVSTCTVTTGADPVPCRFTPPAGGQYVMRFTATDAQGRGAVTGFYRWARGDDWVPWNDESQFKMDVFPDKQRYAVGDTAVVLFASPFTDAEAWITVEREGVIEERRMRISSGSTTLRFPITEEYVPNAFISIVVARGRSAPPGEPDDPGRPTIRVGYTEVGAIPDVKRLDVAVTPEATEYRPGDSVRVDIAVRDHAGAGARSEITLWAVDQGVLALTGYQTPDPVDLVYRTRGLGLRLTSNLVSVAQQLNEAGERTDLQKGGEPGGGGGGQDADILRSQFRATAFFLGAVETDSSGHGVAVAHLPDNLTTFKLMAVAVTTGDRYGSGASEFLVTRPLLARPALPRFVRPGDRFNAGVVVNHRMGGTPTVHVQATAQDITQLEPRRRQVTLEPGRGAEVRFPFAAIQADSAIFRFDVEGEGEADAVRTALPVRPFYHPRAHTIAGTLTDSTHIDLALPAGIDPEQSTVTFDLGSSPLAAMRGAHRQFRVYPYHCTEQMTSTALPLIALMRAQERLGRDDLVRESARADIQLAVRTIERRQRPDGGIGYWSAEHWSTPWLSAYAGQVLLAARGLGTAVDDSTVAGIASYLQQYLRRGERSSYFVARWRDNPLVDLAERVAATEFLRAVGEPEIAAENTLLRALPQMAWEDRVRFAALLSERGDAEAATRVLQAAWNDVRIEGNRATLPGAAHSDFYFTSRMRPMANLLIATMRVQPDRADIGSLVNALVDRTRDRASGYWNTQDYAAMVLALAEFERQQRSAAGRSITVRTQTGLLDLGGPSDPRSALTRQTLPLSQALTRGDDGSPHMRAELRAAGAGPPAYFSVTVDEVPEAPPVRPDEAGIAVERWFEDYESGEPITGIAEGQLVRVRIRVSTSTPRYFVVVDDPLPAGLEAVDASLRTGSGIADAPDTEREAISDPDVFGYYGGRWSPFDHHELRDDRVVFFATELWRGSYTATYVARATTAGTFILPPTHVEEMYNRAVHGRSSGGTFTVTVQP